MEPKSAEKKIERVSKLQKQKLVDYMSSNLEFARGQFDKINANSSFKEQWESLKVYLNSLGGSEKSIEQWKKCWIDLKSGVKKTINSRRKFMNRTGGGSWADVPRDLNPLEEQVLKIITVDAVDGDSCTPESGIIVEESEDFKCIEYLECDEQYIPPIRKSKIEQPSNPSSSEKVLHNKLISTPNPKSSSKYADALSEARSMQNAVMEKLDRIEKQNSEILEKLDRILDKNSACT